VSRLIDFGSAVYPTVSDNAELNEALAANLIDGYMNELKHFRKRKGLTAFGDEGDHSIDAMYRTKVVSAGTMLAVSNGVIYKVASNGTLTAVIGAATTAGNPCSFAEDLANVFIAHGNRLIRVNVTAGTAASMTGGNSPTNATHVAYLDGFLVTNGDIGGGVAGDLNFSDDVEFDYEASDSWEVFNNEAIGDSCAAVAVQWRLLWCFGSESVEASFNDGTTPFARIDGAISPYGLIAPWSVLNIDNTLYYLSRVDGAVRLVRLEGTRPVLASEHYDRQLQGFSNAAIAASRAFMLVDDGKPFYCLTFIADGVTLAFNLRTRSWSQFAFWTGTAYEAFLGQCSEYWPEQKKVLVGSRKTDGKIYSYEGLTDGGSAVRFQLDSNVHQGGTLHKKAQHRVVWNTVGGASKFVYHEAGTAWPTSYLTIYASTSISRRLGRYEARQYRVVHDDTATGFTLIEADEWAEALRQ